MVCFGIRRLPVDVEGEFKRTSCTHEEGEPVITHNNDYAMHPQHSRQRSLSLEGFKILEKNNLPLFRTLMPHRRLQHLPVLLFEEEPLETHKTLSNPISERPAGARGVPSRG